MDPIQKAILTQKVIDGMRFSIIAGAFFGGLLSLVFPWWVASVLLIIFFSILMVLEHMKRCSVTS